MSSILITGGAGFIGTHLCRRLRSGAPRARVRVLDLVPSRHPVEGVEYIQGDVNEPADLARAVEGVDAVYHLAAIVSVPVCQQDPVRSYRTNLGGTLAVLEATKRAGRGARFVLASSAAVYGDLGREREPLGETQPLGAPLSFYGAQKLASEHAVLGYARDLGLPALSFRFFNVFGSGQDASSPYSGVISLFARESAAGRSLKILGDGNQTRDFVAVEDLVDACARVLDLDASKLQGQAVNLGSGQAVRISELAGLVQKISGSTRSLERGPTREGDVRHSLADIRAASALLGWKPSTSLEAGLRTLS